MLKLICEKIFTIFAHNFCLWHEIILQRQDAFIVTAAQPVQPPGTSQQSMAPATGVGTVTLRELCCLVELFV